MRRRSPFWSVLITIFLVVGIGTVFAGILGPSWFKIEKDNSTSSNLGLWTNLCQNETKTTNCFNKLKDRETVFSDLNIVLGLMSATVAFAFIALVPTFSMCCCRTHKNTWNCCSAINIVLIFFSTCFVFGGLGLNEYIIHKEKYTRGWSLACGWAGAVFLLLSLITSTVVLCIGKNAVENDDSYEISSSSKYNYNNRGGLRMQDIRPRVASPKKI